MKTVLLSLLMAVTAPAVVSAQTYENQYRRSVSDVMGDVARRFHRTFRFDMDTTGLTLPYADFRVRPYSLEQTLDNICKYFDWNWWPRSGRLIRISRYEYPRRHVDEGRQMLDYLNTLYHNRDEWETRREVLRREVRARLGIDAFLDSCVADARPVLGPVLRHDGYTTQNICIELTPGEHLYGTVYAPLSGRRHGRPVLRPLIIFPDGHWSSRYRDDEQQRLATLARMGAVCADFDLYGYGQSAAEVGSHATARAHVFQAACGLKLLDCLLTTRRDIDTARVGICGGSGGGTHTVLLALLDRRVTAIAPVVHIASHFDGGCPCESGMPVQLAGGGTCEPELAATFAPRPMLVVSDGGDWTASVPELEFPYLQRIYDFYGAGQQVRNVHLPDERHDFGPSKRQAVYRFFADVFSMDSTRIDESRVDILPPETLQSVR